MSKYTTSFGITIIMDMKDEVILPFCVQREN